MTLRIIGGKWKGRLLHSPPSSLTRPTQGIVREAVFNICQNAIEGARFLDLFAGSGAMGLEALSRGALHATFVEQNRKAAACIQKNIQELQLTDQAAVYACPALAALKRLQTHAPFDIIYMDPPYDMPVASFVETMIRYRLAASEAVLFIEERSRADRCALQFPPFAWMSSRRFGEALLHQYVMTLTSEDRK